jgi:hypothetical protein
VTKPFITKLAGLLDMVGEAIGLPPELGEGLELAHDAYKEHSEEDSQPSQPTSPDLEKVARVNRYLVKIAEEMFSPTSEGSKPSLAATLAGTLAGGAAGVAGGDYLSHRLTGAAKNFATKEIRGISVGRLAGGGLGAAKGALTAAGVSALASHFIQEAKKKKEREKASAFSFLENSEAVNKETTGGAVAEAVKTGWLPQITQKFIDKTPTTPLFGQGEVVGHPD